jgi:intracellular multiplication protein IcmK
MANFFRVTWLYLIVFSLTLFSFVDVFAEQGDVSNAFSQRVSLNRFQQWLQAHGYTSGSVQSPDSSAVPRVKRRQNLSRRVFTINHTASSRKPLTYQQGQRVMTHSVPPTNSVTASSSESIAAFNAMMQQNMPMTPQQVIRLRQQIDVAQRAAAVPPNIPPKPVSTTLMVNLAPGTTPPAVRLALGYVSSLVFVDSTGTPWPIAAFDIGNPKAVSIQWDGKSNILLLQAMQPYSDGDIVVRLVGLPTPVTLELVSGQRVVDYRVDIHVSGIGPNTKELPIGTTLPNSANQLLLGVLDGVAPAGSRALKVVGADCQAWLLGEKIYFRTRLTVLSPGWVGKMVSPDGMLAYELPRTSSVLVSRYGEPVELRIEGL